MSGSAALGVRAGVTEHVTFEPALGGKGRSGCEGRALEKLVRFLGFVLSDSK